MERKHHEHTNNRTAYRAGRSAGLSMLLPPRLTENFEKADQQLREFYGTSPGVPALVRLWLACGASWRIRIEFERAALDIQKRNLEPSEEGKFDENCL
ncbi:MAG: hypothetical protein ACREIA_04590 [Opitutaceae bacterium]